MILSLNLSTDLYLILIPMPVLWKARLPLSKKLGLTVLFSGALFVMTAGALRCILTLKVCFLKLAGAFLGPALDLSLIITRIPSEAQL
jgi:rhodopsin domain-containing protein